jgi:hypothetical protein
VQEGPTDADVIHQAVRMRFGHDRAVRCLAGRAFESTERREGGLPEQAPSAESEVADRRRCGPPEQAALRIAGGGAGGLPIFRPGGIADSRRADGVTSDLMTRRDARRAGGSFRTQCSFENRLANGPDHS